jgi:hypothetical protein
MYKRKRQITMRRNPAMRFTQKGRCVMNFNMYVFQIAVCKIDERKDTGFRMQDTRYRIQDTGCILNPASCIIP